MTQLSHYAMRIVKLKRSYVRLLVRHSIVGMSSNNCVMKRKLLMPR